MDKIQKDNLCKKCKGSGYVPATAGWMTQYDLDLCPRCNGTGEEPVKRGKDESSPFEDEGLGVGEG